MLFRIAWFELRSRLRLLSTYVYFAIFFALGFLWMATAAGAFSGASVDFGAGGKVPVNAPIGLLFLTMLGGYLATITSAAIAGRATFQDVDHRMTPFFFAAPISKLQYLGGRYLGAFLSVFVLYPSISLGALAAHGTCRSSTRAAWVPSRWPPTSSPYLTMLLPNLVFTTSIFFALATLLRRILPVYVGSPSSWSSGTSSPGNIIGDMDNRTLAAMLDPFGGNAADRLTAYWTIAEKSTRPSSTLEGGLPVEPRVLWTKHPEASP